MTRLSLIVAVSENNVIGVDGEIPWHIPEDFRWFKEKTLGKPVVMGRNTFEDIGKPLPGRLNIVLSSQKDLHPDILILSNLNDVFSYLKENGYDHAFIIGGERLYQETFPIVSDMYITRVNKNIDITMAKKVTRFNPDINPKEWRFLSNISGVTNSPKNPNLEFHFQHWIRR